MSAQKQRRKQEDQEKTQTQQQRKQAGRGRQPAKQQEQNTAQQNGQQQMQRWQPGQGFHPRGAARVARLRLARQWKEVGHVYAAIHAYEYILMRYPRSGASAAAAEELLELGQMLEQHGMYYTALNIYDKLEMLA